MIEKGRLLLILMFAAALAGCAPKDGPANIFADAANVQLFHHDEQPGPLKAGPVLTPAQRQRLAQALYFNASEQRATPACYEPHHFFRYFDEDGDEIGTLEVCFCCFQTRVVTSNIVGEFLTETPLADLDGLKALIEELGVRTDIRCHVTSDAE